MKKERRAGITIIVDYPPNYQDIRKFLPEYCDKLVFTYGYRIFNPKGFNIDPGLLRHEMHHADQQAEYGTQSLIILPARFRIRKWWHRYLRDKAFRLSQEIPAYQLQFQAYKQAIKNPRKLHEMALGLAKDLSGPFYGGLISTFDALKAVKADQIYKFKVSL